MMRDLQILIILEWSKKQYFDTDPTTETQRIPSFNGKIAKLDNTVFLGVQFSTDGKKAFVANVGLYEYKLIEGVTPTNKDTMMAHFHSLDCRENEKFDTNLPLSVAAWHIKKRDFTLFHVYISKK